MYSPPRAATPRCSIFSINLPSKYASNLLSFSKLTDFQPRTASLGVKFDYHLKFDHPAAIMVTTNYKSVAYSQEEMQLEIRDVIYIFPSFNPFENRRHAKCNFLSSWRTLQPLLYFFEQKQQVLGSTLLLHFCDDCATISIFLVQFKINQSTKDTIQREWCIWLTERVVRNSICKLFPVAQKGHNQGREKITRKMGKFCKLIWLERVR